MFYYATYPDRVGLEKAENENERRALILQINSFGQTPAQIFETKHPKRRLFKRAFLGVSDDFLRGSVSVSLEAFSPSTVEYIALESKFGFGQDLETEICILATRNVFQEGRETLRRRSVLTFTLNQGVGQSSAITETDVGSAVPTVEIPSELPQSSWMISSVSDRGQFDVVDSRFIECGFRDGTVREIQFSALGGRSGNVTSKVVLDHRNGMRINCVKRHGKYLASGSIMVVISRDVDDGGRSFEDISTLVGHEGPVQCVDFNADLDLVVSGSLGGLVLEHALFGGRLTRVLLDPLPGSEVLYVGVVNDDGAVAVARREGTDIHLLLFSINGTLLGERRLEETRVLFIGVEMEHMVLVTPRTFWIYSLGEELNFKEVGRRELTVEINYASLQGGKLLLYAGSTKRITILRIWERRISEIRLF